LARLLIRRTLRMLRRLGIENELVPILHAQIDYWGGDFPQLVAMRNEVAEAIKSEENKYRRTLERGSELVKKIAIDLKRKNETEMPSETLVELYDSHGIVPDIVKEVAEPLQLEVNPPSNFYGMVAQRHLARKSTTEEQPTSAPSLSGKVEKMPETITLYYKDPFQREFQAQVIGVVDKQFVIL